MFTENKWSELQIMPGYVNPAVGDFGKITARYIQVFPIHEVKVLCERTEWLEWPNAYKLMAVMVKLHSQGTLTSQCQC
jgi:hypothetical protein